MNAFEKFIAILGVIIAVAAGGLITMLYARGRVSNCGGNSAAMSDCRNISLELTLAATDLKKSYSVKQLPEDKRAALAERYHTPWTPGAKFLIRTNINVGKTPKEIIVVCDTAYNNIPQPTVWNGYRKNPVHAAGYSDGSAGLISPAEFQKLNLSEFVEASTLTNEVAAPKDNPSE